MSEERLPGLAPVNTLAGLDVTALGLALRVLFEDAGPLVAVLVGRSFKSWEEVIDAALQAIVEMDDPTRAELLRAHPRIGTRAPALAARSTLSYIEQGADTPIPEELAQRLDELNDAYEARFGFPFVEWVAGRSKAEMVPLLEGRLQRDRAAELTAGTTALVDIARDRLSRLRSGAP